jgi:hypothetical protein
MDSDDISFLNRFELQYTFLRNNSSYGICGSNILLFGKHNQINQYPESHDDLIQFACFSTPFAHPAVMFDIKVLKDNNLNYSSLHPYAEDYDLWVKLLRVTKGYNLQNVLLKYRVHNYQTSTINNINQLNTSKIIKFQNMLWLYPSIEESKCNFLINCSDGFHFGDILEIVNNYEECFMYLISIENKYLNNKLIEFWINFIKLFPKYSFDNFILISNSILFKQISFRQKLIFLIKSLLFAKA